ncbi:MAG: MMPL family transporter, partial [Chloroflexi bacterium]|nr:MMPL family transporter [Chloroflexota bacterium]
FQDKVNEVFGRIEELGPDVTRGGTNFYLSNDPSLVSDDRHTTILPFTMAGEFIDAADNVEGVFDVVTEVDGSDGFEVLIVGEASSAFESNKLATSDINQGESRGVPVAMIILLVLFGAVIAALLPLFLAVVAIVIATGAVAVVGQVFQLIFFVELMIVMIGLAVGIDYSLLVVSRYREELGKGHDKIEALTRTGATASRTVFFSGLTVVIALSGMLIVPSTVFQGLGTGAILVVVAAVAAALTLLPAVLSLLGHRIGWLRVPFIGRRTTDHSASGGGGFWGRVTRVVMAHPVLSFLTAGGVMIAAAVPAFDLTTGFNGVDTLPESSEVRAGFLLLEQEFAFGVASPTEIVVDGDVDSPAVQAAIERLRNDMRGDPDFVGDATVEINDARDLALVSQAIAGEPSGEQATAAVIRLRDDYIPGAFAGSGADVFVTGLSAFNQDFFDQVSTYTPIVFAVVLMLSLVLLTVVFRSIVIPIKSIILNLLSVGAAYGLIVLVTQQGVGADLFGFQQSDVVEAWIPLFLFSVLFGLSMDYHVFLLSRIRERYDQTRNNAESVAYGLRATAGLITGAALIMVAVFSGFATGELVSNQQVGFGLSIAIFLDATIVRSILVPASMRLLGRANWYFPTALNWVPRIGIEGNREPEAAPAG